MTKRELEALQSRKAKVKEIEEEKGYNPKEANILVNTTKEDKEVKFDGKPYVIEASKEKPFANYIISLFLTHCDGLEIKEEDESEEEVVEEKSKKKVIKKK